MPASGATVVGRAMRSGPHPYAGMCNTDSAMYVADAVKRSPTLNSERTSRMKDLPELN